MESDTTLHPLERRRRWWELEQDSKEAPLDDRNPENSLPGLVALRCARLEGSFNIHTPANTDEQAAVVLGFGSRVSQYCAGVDDTIPRKVVGASTISDAHRVLERDDSSFEGTLDDSFDDDKRPAPSSDYLPSQGSVDHNYGNCSPCYFFSKQHGCRRGFDCNFCHFFHGPSKNMRPSKDKREKLKNRAKDVVERCQDLAKLQAWAENNKDQ